MDKICLMGISFGNPNMGIGALSMGVVKCALHQFPKVKLFLCDYEKEKKDYQINLSDKTVSIEPINIRFSKKLYLANNIFLLTLYALFLKLIPFEKIKKSLFSKNYCLKRILESDIIASIAGGDSFSDIYGISRFFYVSLPQILALFMGKRLILLPQTLGPFKGTISRVVARYILNNAFVVYSRDYQGISEINNLIKSDKYAGKIRFCFDVGFVLDPVRPAICDLGDFPLHEKHRFITVGLNISGLLYEGGYTNNNMFKLKVDYNGLIQGVLDYFMEIENVKVLLIPHVLGKSKYLDSDICERIYNAYKSDFKDRIYLANGLYDQGEIKYIIGLCDFFIGSRMHACIAALSQSIPTVSLAYSKKFFGVMQTIGVESLVADMNTLKKEDIIKVIDESFGKREAIHKHIEEIMPHVKSTILNLFKVTNYEETT